MLVQPQDALAVVPRTLGNTAKDLLPYAAPSHIQWLLGKY